MKALVRFRGSGTNVTGLAHKNGVIVNGKRTAGQRDVRLVHLHQRSAVLDVGGDRSRAIQCDALDPYRVQRVSVEGR